MNLFYSFYIWICVTWTCISINFEVLINVDDGHDLGLSWLIQLLYILRLAYSWIVNWFFQDLSPFLFMCCSNYIFGLNWFLVSKLFYHSLYLFRFFLYSLLSAKLCCVCNRKEIFEFFFVLPNFIWIRLQIIDIFLSFMIVVSLQSIFIRENLE